MAQTEKPFSEQENGGASRYPALTDAYPALRHDVQRVRIHHLLQRVWNRRRLVAWWVGAFLAAGILFILGSRREYEASTVLLLEQPVEEGASTFTPELLEQFGGLLGGGGLGSLGQTELALTFELYPDVLESTPVQRALLDTRVAGPSIDSAVPLHTYLAEHLPFSIWDVPGEALGAAISAIRGGSVHEDAVTDTSLLVLSAEERRLLGELKDRFAVDYDQRTELLTISAEMPDPFVAAQTTDAAVEQLTKYVTAYRTKKLTDELRFLEGRYAEARRRFLEAADRLARYQDRNQNLALNVARTEEKRLEAEFDLANTMYQSLASKVEEAKFRVQKETPVLQVLEPVAVPHQKSSPQTLLILALCLLLGLVTSIVYVLLERDTKVLVRMMRREGAQRHEAAVNA